MLYLFTVVEVGSAPYDYPNAYLPTLDKLFVLQLILAQDKYSTLDLMQTQA
jgi:hypothetical protein